MVTNLKFFTPQNNQNYEHVTNISNLNTQHLNTKYLSKNEKTQKYNLYGTHKWKNQP